MDMRAFQNKPDRLQVDIPAGIDSFATLRGLFQNLKFPGTANLLTEM